MAVKARRAASDYRPGEVRAYVAQNFSREVMAGHYAALYNDLIEKGAAGLADKAAAKPLAA
jgi:hypothetical protein